MSASRMPRDLKSSRGNSGKYQEVEEIENVPINPNDSALNPKPSVDQSGVGSAKRKCEWTPVKAKGKVSDTVSTPERLGNGILGRKRLALSSVHDEGQPEMANHLSQLNRNVSYLNLTPRVGGTVGRVHRGYSEREACSSLYTPARVVSKPPNPGFAPLTTLRHHGNTRVGGYTAGSRRFSVSGGQPCSTVNTVEVPHFELKEDPSFWMDHNVQVIIRVRPLNSFEINANGYNRCVKQENAQSITWIGQPETRFTFDHVACETVDQEMLFRMSGLPMVENCLSGYNSCMFAYGQTGSGKTYTMLGEMEDLEFRPSSHRGMTPRIFEFLFARISAEEESRRDEKLKYSCKCSFLEIYNEQITDLLDPTSTNLLLREDAKKGVYVENLSEFEVHSVSDVLKLLIQGSSNRRVAATDMNRESSRSHSVFTCIVESKWERDSTTNLRFARLNLVDLAGSERQKLSGAEGERLKEAANINKSLSSLGHVIMLLVDIAQGKQKHVPYRDSRLTFLLQDSLGGNSKTMIIANISPSICCAAETLNTLKFAQRAKLIQNNAVVNEDSSGDVAFLQHQIWLLREELATLKHQTISRRLAFDSCSTTEDQKSTDTEIRPERDEQKADNLKLKSMDKMLAGALRREHIAETSIKELKAEIEQLHLLVHQREEDTKCTKMMLKFREEKIKRMESLLGDLKPVDAYLLEENAALSEEIQLLRAKVDKNPEVTRFASENIRLQEQLRRFQDFYEEGERDILMNEISELRTQILQFLDGHKCQCDLNVDQVSTNNIQGNVPIDSELAHTLKELAECRSKLKSCLESNTKLNREIDDLHSLLKTKEVDMKDDHGTVMAFKDVDVPCVVGRAFDTKKCISKHEVATHSEVILNLELELDILKIMLKEERLSRGKMEEMVASLARDAKLAEERMLLLRQQCDDAKRDLKEAKSVIEALESQQLLSISEIEDLKSSNDHYLELLNKQEVEISALKQQTVRSKHSRFRPSELRESPLQAQLKRMQASLDKAKGLNMWYQNDHAAQRSNEEEMDKIRRQAEAETADVIISLQDELSMLQHRVEESDLKEKEAENKVLILENNLKELQETLNTTSQDAELLHQNLMEKDREIKSLKEDWEILSSEIEEALHKGNETLESVCGEVDSFSRPLSDRRVWVSEQMSRMIKHISEKESIIQELNQCLEDANVRANGMEDMLRSLRGAALVFTESHEQDLHEREEEASQLRAELSRKTHVIEELEQRLKLGREEMMKASTCATAAFIVVKNLSEVNSSYLDALRTMDMQLRELQETNQKALVQPGSAIIQEICEVDSSLAVQLGAEALNPVLGAGKTADLVAHDSSEVIESCNGSSMKDTTDILLGNEIESAVGSLTETQAEISHLSAEVKEINLSEGKACDVIEGVEALQLSLEAAFSKFEKQCESRMLVLNHKLRNVEECAQEAKRSWLRMKKLHEFELSDAMDQRTAESEKALDKIKEADERISDMVMASETIKLEIENLKEINVMLTAERESLITEVQDLQCSNDVKDQNCKDLEEQIEWDVSNIKRLVEDVVVSVSEAKGAYEESLTSIAHDFNSVKFQIQDTMKWMHLSFEEITSEILAKDCALFTSYHCYMGALLDAIMRLQSENSLLDVGICQSDAVMSKLRVSLIEQERLLKNNEEVMESQVDRFMLELITKDFELLILASELQQLAYRHADKEQEQTDFCSTRDCLMTDVVSLRIVADFSEQLVAESENELIGLRIKAEESRDGEAIMLKKLQKLEEEYATLKEHLSLKEKENESFKNKLQEMESNNCNLLKDIQEKDLEYHSLMGCIGMLKSEKCRLEEDISSFESRTALLEEDLEIKKAELNEMSEALCSRSQDLENYAVKVKELQDENLFLRDKLLHLRQSYCEPLRTLTSKVEECIDYVRTADLQSCGLLEQLDKSIKILIGKISQDACQSQDVVLSFLQDLEFIDSNVEGLVAENLSLQEQLSRKEDALNGLLFDLRLLQENAANSEDQMAEIKKLATTLKATEDELAIRSSELDEAVAYGQNLRVELKEQTDIVTALKMDSEKANHSLKLLSTENMELRSNVEDVVAARASAERELTEKTGIVAALEMDLEKANHSLKLLSEENMELRSHIEDIMAARASAEREVTEKTGIVAALEMDLEKANHSLKRLSDENVEVKSHIEDIMEARASAERELTEKTGIVTALEMDLEKANHSLKLLSNENMELKSHIEDIKEARASTERELTEKTSVVDGLENELLQMGDTVGQMNALVESLESNLAKAMDEKDQLQKKVMVLEEKLETACALAEENEAVAAECKEIAESRRIYAEEKEEEVKLLERSVQELGSSIAALENKIGILKNEAERQQMKRETLESEVHSLKSYIRNIESVDADMKRDLDEKANYLREALKHVKVVEEDLINKDREIAQCKTQIKELTVHADGQTSKLCRAESFLLQFMEELVQHRVSSGASSSITFNELQNKKLKGTEKKKLLLETLKGLHSNFPEAAGVPKSRYKSNNCTVEEALELSGVSTHEM